jgi:dTDP-4-dehydrorhamnose reductase
MRKVMILGGTGLIGKAIAERLKDKYEIIIVSGHHEISQGYTCRVEDTERLLDILNREIPDIVISTLVGAFDAQLKYHDILGAWLKNHGKR